MTLLERLWNGLYRKYWSDEWKSPEEFYEEFSNEHGETELYVGSLMRCWHSVCDPQNLDVPYNNDKPPLRLYTRGKARTPSSPSRSG